MAATPETLRPVDHITEPQQEFIIDETLKRAGAQVVQKNFTAQVKSDSGKPLIQTPPTQVITVKPPYTQSILTSQSKGPITSSLTWLSIFWLRIIKKALHLGWKIVGQ